MIVQDRLDLATQGLTKKVVLALVSAFAIFLVNIILENMVVITTKESLPSWELSFLLVTNQLSLNTKKF
jgi:hypothetical protein